MSAAITVGAAAVEADRHAAPRGLLAHERHQRRAVHARGIARAERAQRPHERHSVGGDELGVVHERAERRVVPGLHHHVDVGDAGHAAARLGHREDRCGSPRGSRRRRRACRAAAASRAGSGARRARAWRCEPWPVARRHARCVSAQRAPALNSRATRRAKAARRARPIRSGVGRRSNNRRARRARAWIAQALFALLPFVGCGPSAPAELPGAWWAGRAAVVRDVLAQIAQLEGTPLARRARELAAALPECESVGVHAPDGDVAKLAEGARCLARRRPARADPPRVGKRSGLRAARATRERRALRGALRFENGALTLDLRWPDPPADGALAPARARRRAGRPRSAREHGATRRRCACARARDSTSPRSCPKTARPTGCSGSRAESSRARCSTAPGRAAVYLPERAGGMPGIAIALGFSARSAAVAAIEHFDRRSPADLARASQRAARPRRRRRLPARPERAARARAVLCGDRRRAGRGLERREPRSARSRASRARSAPDAPARLDLDLALIQRADDLLARAFPGSQPPLHWPWSRVLASGGERGRRARAARDAPAAAVRVVKRAALVFVRPALLAGAIGTISIVRARDQLAVIGACEAASAGDTARALAETEGRTGPSEIGRAAAECRCQALIATGDTPGCVALLDPLVADPEAWTPESGARRAADPRARRAGPQRRRRGARARGRARPPGRPRAVPARDRGARRGRARGGRAARPRAADPRARRRSGARARGARAAPPPARRSARGAARARRRSARGRRGRALGLVRHARDRACDERRPRRGARDLSALAERGRPARGGARALCARAEHQRAARPRARRAHGAARRAARRGRARRREARGDGRDPADLHARERRARRRGDRHLRRAARAAPARGRPPRGARARAARTRARARSVRGARGQAPIPPRRGRARGHALDHARSGRRAGRRVRGDSRSRTARPRRSQRAAAIAPQRWVLRARDGRVAASGTAAARGGETREIEIHPAAAGAPTPAPLPSLTRAPADGRRRVALVLLDCGDWAISQYLRTRGDLPVLDALLRSGYRAVLDSDPPLTAAALEALVWPERHTDTSIAGAFYRVGVELAGLESVGQQPVRGALVGAARDAGPVRGARRGRAQRREPAARARRHPRGPPRRGHRTARRGAPPRARPHAPRARRVRARALPGPRARERPDRRPLRADDRGRARRHRTSCCARARST